MNPDSMNPDSMNPNGGGLGAVDPNLYICENGTEKAGDVPSGSSDADKMICTACNSGYIPTDVPDTLGNRCVQVDSNNNKLIDITTLTQLHYMRHNVNGLSYKTELTGENDNGVRCGTPEEPEDCKGYELMNNLSFDLDGDDDDDDDDSTYTGDQTAGYILDNDDNAAPYFVVTGDATNYSGGWLPIDNFATTFEGNHKTITGLAIRRNSSNIGMFGSLTGDGVVRNIHLDKNLAQYTGSSSSNINVGGLVGKSSGGTIVASSTTGNVHHGASENANVGGLVGILRDGTIVASYATGKVSGAFAGGLVGNNGSSNTIVASFARGDVVGSANNLGHVGGLVGRNGGFIIASHASGNIYSSAGGDSDYVGGLVGYLSGGGSQVVASIATGSVTKGSGATNTRVGALVGFRLSDAPLPIASYGFGTPTGTTVNSDDTAHPSATSAAGLTLANVDNANNNRWNLKGEKTLDAWVFEAGKAPKLQFADYDGDGTVYSCSASESTNVATTIVIDGCSDTNTLIPGQ